MRYLMACAAFFCVSASLSAQPEVEPRLAAIEKRLEKVEVKTEFAWEEVKTAAPIGVVVFLYGVFCALWAQNTGRRPWVWFFFGVLFSVITVIVLLSDNASDRRKKRPIADGVEGEKT